MAGVPDVAPLDEFDPSRLGPYTLLGRLGEGGMGTVYLARRTDGADAGIPGGTGAAGGGPLVAIKVIRADLARIPEFRGRFRREAHAAQRVRPSYTAEVLDVGTASGRPYLVTQYIEGPTLSARVRERGPLSAVDLEWLAEAVASALRAIHAAGVIHRDLKPANILLSPFGARVIDFGIARALDATTMATEGAIGTPAYMAPEQVLGDEVTEATDIHSWGAVLLYAVTGRAPFDGDTIHTILRRVIEDSPDLTDVAVPLRPLVSSAMSKAPVDRPTATELLDLLQRLHTTPTPAGRTDVAIIPPVPVSGADGPIDTGSMSSPPVPSPPPIPNRRPKLEVTPPSISGDQPTSQTDRSATRAALTRPGVGPEPAPRTPEPPARPPRRRWRTIAIATTAVVAIATAVTAYVLTTHSASRPTPLGRPLTGPAGSVLSVAFSPDGHTLAAGSWDDTVRLWNVRNPASPKSLGQPLAGSGGAVDSVAFSPDGHTLAAGSTDHTVQLWNVKNPASPTPFGRPLTGPAGSVLSVAFSPDGHTLAASSADDTIQLWNVTSPASPQSLGEPLTGPTDAVDTVVFSPDGQTLAAGSYDRTVRLWNVKNPASPTPLGEPLTGPTLYVFSVVFSPDGHTLAASSWDSTVWFWNVTSPASPESFGEPLDGPDHGVYSVVFSPDGNTLAAGNADGTVQLWGAASRIPLGQPLAGPTGVVDSVAISPNGRTLAAGSTDHAVRLWKLH
jgi:serine/threonine protein kinase/Tol biopolymer transport system component